MKYLQPTWGDHAVITRLFWEQDDRQGKVKTNLSHTQILLNPSTKLSMLELLVEQQTERLTALRQSIIRT